MVCCRGNDISEGINFYKSKASKECMVCYY